MSKARLFGVALLGVVTVATPHMVLAQAPGDHRDIPQLLETARLSPEGKVLVRQKAAEAVQAGVEEGEVAGVIRRGLDRRLQGPELVRLLEVVAQAKRQDLPVGPVLDKVKEGLAKGVPPERIAGVAAIISGNLAASRDVIRRAEREGVRAESRDQRDKTIEAVADALGRGVTTAHIEDLTRRVALSPQREATLARLQVAAQATADLVAMGLTPRDASETAAAAVAKGLSQRDVERLPERLAHELRRGRSPADGAKYVREAIQSGRPEQDRERGAKPEIERIDRGGGKPSRY